MTAFEMKTTPDSLCCTNAVYVFSLFSALRKGLPGQEECLPGQEEKYFEMKV